MLSQHHRENLLNPDYNVAGFAVVRNGSTIYVTEDFGHGLPSRKSRLVFLFPLLPSPERFLKCSYSCGSV
jgi:hypothetical protein